jgi:hypothetical protein
MQSRASYVILAIGLFQHVLRLSMVIFLSGLPFEKNVNVTHRVGEMTSGIAELTQPEIPVTGVRPEAPRGVCFRDAN